MSLVIQKQVLVRLNEPRLPVCTGLFNTRTKIVISVISSTAVSDAVGRLQCKNSRRKI